MHSLRPKIVLLIVTVSLKMMAFFRAVDGFVAEDDLERKMYWEGSQCQGKSN